MTLKRELEKRDSPIRVFFAERLPNTKLPRVEFAATTAPATTTLPRPVPGGDPFPDQVPWSLLGHAISARLLWDITPRALDLEPGVLPRIPTIAGISANGLEYHFGKEQALVNAMAAAIDAGPDVAGPDLAARVSWVGGLLDQAYRADIDPSDPWFEGIHTARTWEQLLTSVPDWVVTDLITMHSRSAPHLTELAGEPIAVAPVFAGSGAVGGADGDVIVGGTLLDVKATKESTLRLRDLHQIVAYALLDWTDSHHITAVGILAVRQGVLRQWPLEALLTGMAGRPVDVARLRSDLRAHLLG